MRYSRLYSFQGGWTIDEFIDLVQTEISVSCALPKTLP